MKWPWTKSWNVKEINAFADFIEDHEDLEHAANIQLFAALGFFLRVMGYGALDRHALAAHLGLDYGKINQILFPRTEGKMDNNAVYGRPEIVKMLRYLAKTGQVKWTG